MNNIQPSKLNALLSVQTLFLANPTPVASIAALEEAAEELTDLISSINTHVKVQSSPSGAAEAKSEALIALGNIAFEVAGGILSFAEKGGDLTLARKASFSRSVITEGSSNAVVARIQGIIDAAAETLSSLGDHGITQAKVNSLKQRLKTYDSLRGLPRQATAAAASATRQLEKLFPKTTRLLDNRIDRLVWQFRESAPEFYEKYQVARRTVNAPTTSAAETPSVVPVRKRPEPLLSQICFERRRGSGSFGVFCFQSSV